MQIPVHKTSVMQAMQSAVARGYTWHVSGVVSAEKLLALEEKFAERYDIGLSRWQRCRQRQKGAAGVRFFAYPEQGTTRFLWWLLFTDGENAAFQREHGRRQVSDKYGRLSWGTEFELAQLPSLKAKPTWSWRMTRERVQEWQGEIQAAIRTTRSDDAIKAVMARLVRLPGFKGVRQQFFELHGFAKKTGGASDGRQTPGNHRHVRATCASGLMRLFLRLGSYSGCLWGRLLSEQSPSFQNRRGLRKKQWPL